MLHQKIAFTFYKFLSSPYFSNESSVATKDRLTIVDKERFSSAWNDVFFPYFNTTDDMNS